MCDMLYAKSFDIRSRDKLIAVDESFKIVFLGNSSCHSSALSHSAPVLPSAASALPQYIPHKQQRSLPLRQMHPRLSTPSQATIPPPAAPCRGPRLSAKAEPPLHNLPPNHHATSLFPNHRPRQRTRSCLSQLGFVVRLSRA